MKIKNKNYPHPVLAPYSDDILSSIECNIEVEWDKSYYYFKYDFGLENETINEFIKANKIHYIIHVECGKTFYRKIFKINVDNIFNNRIIGTITIPASHIKDTTHVSVFVCASSQIDNYLPVGMHPDYDHNSFFLENGDFIAVWKTYVFDLYQDYDPIKKVDSIISFQRDENRETGEIVVDPVKEKLTAVLPKDLHQMYHDLKADKSKEDILMSMLGVPILMEGLLYIKENTNHEDGINLSTCRRYRWFRSLEKKLADMNVDINNQDCLFAIAQRIFENPCKKAGKAFEELDKQQD